jgi:hypothetical protein
MGNKLVLTGTKLTGTSAPYLPVVDPMENSGSLMLIEPGHPSAPYAGTPATGALLPNLLSGKALGMIPTATSDTLAAKLTIGADMTGTMGKVERSAKGGLHLLMSQANPGTVARYAQIDGQAAVRNYLIANPAHDVFVSMWGSWTRPPVALASGAGSHAFMSATSGDWFRFYHRTTGTTAGETEYPTDATRLGYRHNNMNPTISTGAFQQNIGRHPDKAPAAGALMAILLMGNQAYPIDQYAKVGSMIFYRFYMEDLTVSGRTYAQADAQSFAEYTKQCLTAGGRYYGDTTPTSPAIFG